MGQVAEVGPGEGEPAAPELDGALIPSSSVGNNRTWIDMADKVILEVNSWQPIELAGMHAVPDHQQGPQPGHTAS